MVYLPDIIFGGVYPTQMYHNIYTKENLYGKNNT